MSSPLSSPLPYADYGYDGVHADDMDDTDSEPADGEELMGEDSFGLDNGKDVEGDEYERANPETEEDREFLIAHESDVSPDSEAEHVHHVVNGMQVDSEYNDSRAIVDRLSSKYGDELIPSTSDSDVTPDGRRPAFHRLVRNDDNDDDETNGVLEMNIERGQKERSNKARESGNIGDYFVRSGKSSASSAKRRAAIISSDDESDANNSTQARSKKRLRVGFSPSPSPSPEPVPQPQPQPQPQPEPQPEPQSEEPVMPDLSGDLSNEHKACAFRGVQHLFVPKHVSPRNLHALSPISDPPEFYSYLFPLDIFHWHESRTNFRMFQASYFMAWIASALQYQGAAITVHFWPITFSSIREDHAMTSFYDSCNSDHEVVYFVNIIVYSIEALELFSKRISHDPNSLKAGSDNSAAGLRKNNPYSISRESPRKTATGNLKYICERRLPRREWLDIAPALFTRPDHFSSALVLLAQKCGTINRGSSDLNIVENRHKILNFSYVGTEDSGEQTICESQLAQEMFGIKNVVASMFQESNIDFVTEVISGLNPGNDLNDNGAIQHFLWPKDFPSYHLSINSVCNIPLWVDAIESSTINLSKKLVKDIEGQRDMDEITVPPVSGLESLEEILEDIVKEIKKNEEISFDELLSISRLILTQNCQFHNPWQRQILNFAKRIVETKMDVKKLKHTMNPEYIPDKDKFHYFANESMKDLFHHCEHGMQMGNLHTPMAKLVTLSLTALLRNPPQEQVPGALLNGIFSGGKSYMLQQIEDMFPRGAAEKSVGGSNQAEMENTHQKIVIHNELDPRLLSKNKHMQGLSIAKTVATEKGKNQYKRMQQSSDGGPYEVETVEFNARHTTFRAMNTDVNDLDPAMRSRCVCMTVGDENKPEGSEKRDTNSLSLSATSEPSQKIKKGFTETFQFRFWLFHVVDTISGYCVNKTHNGDLYSFMFSKIAKVNSSLNISNPRTAGFVQNFARTHTIMSAVYLTMNNFECFAPNEINELRKCIVPGDVTSKQSILVGQLAEMSAKPLMERVMTRPWALIMSHFANFDDAASILYGMSIPFDTTSANAAKMILIVLKDLCYGGSTNQEASEYMTIKYNTSTLVTAICTKMPKFGMKEKDEDHVRMALMSLASRIVTSVEGASVDAQAIIFRDKTVDVHKGLLSTTTTPMEKRAIDLLINENLFEKVKKQNTHSLQQNNKVWEAFESTGATELYKLHASSPRCTAFENRNRDVFRFIDKLSVMHTTKFCVRVEAVIGDTHYYINPEMMEIFTLMNTSNGSKRNETAEIHTGFSRVAKVVGCFHGESMNDNYVVVEPETRNSIKYGMISADKAEDYEPDDKEYTIRNPRFIPAADLSHLPPHCQDIVKAESGTSNEFIKFEKNKNNEDIQERKAFQVSEIYKLLGKGGGDSEGLRRMVYAKISRAGVQKSYREMSKRGEKMPYLSACEDVKRISREMEICDSSLATLDEATSPQDYQFYRARSLELAKAFRDAKDRVAAMEF